MQSLYEWDFRGQGDPVEILERNCNTLDTKVDEEFAKDIISSYVEHKDEVDGLIAKAAPEWPIEQIARVDRNILRISITELQYRKDVPPKVAINEAIELAKNYGGENSSKFVNGVLGNVYRAGDRFEEKASTDKENDGE